MSRRRVRGDSGAVAVEFAIIFPFLAMVISFAIVAGLYVFWSALAEYTTRDAARFASIQTAGGGYPSSAEVSSHAANQLGGVLGAPTAITVLDCHTNDAAVDEANCDTEDSATSGEGDIVTVRLTYHVPGIGPLAGLVNAVPGFGGLDLTGLATIEHSARARRE